jgi:hypothetical protein
MKVTSRKANVTAGALRPGQTATNTLATSKPGTSTGKESLFTLNIMQPTPATGRTTKRTGMAQCSTQTDLSTKANGWTIREPAKANSPGPTVQHTQDLTSMIRKKVQASLPSPMVLSTTVVSEKVNSMEWVQ